MVKHLQHTKAKLDRLKEAIIAKRKAEVNDASHKEDMVWEDFDFLSHWFIKSRGMYLDCF